MKLKTVLLAGASLLAMTTHAWSFEVLGSLLISAIMAVPGGIAILPVASAAAIGQAVVGVALVAANIAASFMQRRPSINPSEFKNTFEETGNQSEIRAIGRVRVGGLKVFGNTKGLNRYRLIAHTKGIWSGTEEHYLGGREITVESDGQVSSPPWARQGGSWVFLRSKIGDGTETAWPQLMAEFPDLWTSAHRVRGIAQTLAHYVSPGLQDEGSIRKFQLLYQNGEPPYERVGRAEPVFDPRDGGQSATDPATWQWRDNGILGATHILRSFPNIRASDLDYLAIGGEATKADQNVTSLVGPKPRSRASGFWTSESSRGDIMEQVLRSIGAEIVQTDDNRYALRLIDDERTADVVFTAKHIVGIEWRSGPESVERPNVCRVRFYSPERNYEMADIDMTGIEWARVESEIDRVGEQYYDVDLPFCSDASQAQRIARRLFALARADAGTVTLNMAGLAAWGLSMASLEFPDIETTELCAIGTPRVDDEAGTVSMPFIVWPYLPPWNPETDEAPAPEAIPDMQYPSELDTPAAPSEAAVVQYPDSSFETRVKFAAVPGGSIAEAVYRTWPGGQPAPFQSMTEYNGDGTTRYAWDASDTTGARTDFKCRFFNGDDEGSYYSPLLTIDPMEIDNSVPDAPAFPVTVTDDGSGNFTFDCRASVTQMHVARLVIERWGGFGGGSWAPVATGNGRPSVATTHTFTQSRQQNPVTVQARAIAYTSDGTASAPTNFSFTISGEGN